MKAKSVLFLLAGAIILAAAVGVHEVRAQAYPSKPIKIIVPFPPGNTVDTQSRLVGPKITERLGQPVIVENRVGASGMLGLDLVAKAPPDGYTLGAGQGGNLCVLPHTSKNVPYNVLKDFTPIALTTTNYLVIYANTGAPFKTLPEMIAYAKANPGKLTYATPGNGTSLHMTMEDIAQREGLKWTQVPYKGYAEAAQGLLGGHVDAHADSTGWAEQVNAGRLRLLCTWGAARTKRWPNVPTLKDLGYPIVSNSPYGLAGPKGMDPAVVKVLHDGFKKAMDDPKHQEMLDTLNQDVWYKTGDEYMAWARATYTAEPGLIERLGLLAK
jgi:tripartite-type tricarboxylate transporter receptor subunit TctC